MPRTNYDDNGTFEQYDVAKRKLSDDMSVDNYTGGLMSSAAGSQANSISDQVPRSRSAKPIETY